MKPLTTPPVPIPRFSSANDRPKTRCRSSSDVTVASMVLEPENTADPAVDINVADTNACQGWCTSDHEAAPHAPITISGSTTRRGPMRSIKAPHGPASTRLSTPIHDTTTPTTVASMPRTSCK